MSGMNPVVHNLNMNLMQYHFTNCCMFVETQKSR